MTRIDATEFCSQRTSTRRTSRLAALLIAVMLAAVGLMHAVRAGSSETSSGVQPVANLAPGDAPAFKAKLVALEGRPVVVSFWASWCGTCYEDTPALVALSRRDSAKASFLGIAVRDSASDAAGFVRQFGIAYPVLLDANGSIAAAEGVFGLPTLLLFGPDRSLQRTWRGAVDASEVERALAGGRS